MQWYLCGELGVLRFRVGGAGSGRGRGGLRTNAADHANAIVPDVGNVRDCDVTFTQVSLVGLWGGCSVLLVYLWPEGLRFSHEDAGHGETE